MKKFLLFLMFALCCIPWVANAQTVTIGTGTTTQNMSPIANYYNYSFTEMIYTSEEIAAVDHTADNILSVGFQLASAGLNNKTYSIEIYMKNVEENQFESAEFIAVSATDLVYNGTVTATASGWVTIDLDSPFLYNNQNLLIAINKTAGGYAGSSYYWNYTSTSESGLYQNLYKQNDGSAYSISSLPTSPTRNYNRPNVQLIFGSSLCPKPTGLAVDPSTDPVTVTWDYDPSYSYHIKIDGTALNQSGNSVTSPFSIYDLDPNTNYTVDLRTICNASDSSSWAHYTFTTPAGIPLVEEFSTTSLPVGWTRYSGLLDDVMGGTVVPTSITSGWNFGTANSVFDNHARVNIYGTGCRYWLVTPALAMEDNVQLTFDLALTKYSGTLQPVDATQQADDRFVVLIATFGTDTTLNILREWNNTGSEYVYNDIACSATGENVSIDLSSYAGQQIAIAFYGESTVTGNGDNNLHIDNVSIDYIPNCPKPTGLAAADPYGHGATLSWTSEATAWEVAYKASTEEDFTMVPVTENPYTISGLDPETSYTVKVRANCSGAYSDWSNSVNFTTAVACPAPTGVTTSNITAHGVTVTWTAEEGAVYQYQMIKTADYDPEDIYWSASTQSNSMSWNNLDPETSYTLALRKDCNSANDGYSQVVTKTFTTDVACPAPSSLTKTELTAHSAKLGWTENGEATEWVVYYYKESEEELVTAHTEITVTENPYTLYDLEPSTEYVVAVKAVCGGIDGESQYSSTTFTTTEECPAPTNLVCEGTTTTTATLSWFGGENDMWDILLLQGSDTIGTYIAEPEPTYTVGNLQPGTVYSFKVRTSCGETWSTVKTFTTAFSIPFVEPFATTSAPAGWTRYSGLLSDVMSGTAPTATTSGWNFNTGNGITDNHAKVNIYGTNCRYWLVTPTVLMDENVQLTFDLALTVWSSSSSASPTAGNQADDKFAVLITTNGGTSWEVLRQWDNAGSEYVYDEIPNTLTETTIDLSSYANSEYIAIAFYGESTVAGGDNNLHIDNVKLDYIPTCNKPTNLTVNYTGGNEATITWTSEAEAFNIDVNGTVTPVTGNTYALTDLDFGTTYVVKVQTDCGSVGVSEWTDPVSFTTDLCAAENVCAITIELTDSYGDGWNGGKLEVVDVLTTNVLGSYTISSGSSASYTLNVCADRDINIVYTAGSYAYENGWVITDINEEIISEHAGGNSSNAPTSGVQATYTVNCVVTDCRTPSELAASEFGSTSAVLSWTENGPAIEWTIYYKAETAEEFSTATATENPYTLTGLDSETEYTVYVVPVCEVEKPSAEITFTTLPACPAPTNLTYAMHADGVTVNWNGTSDSYNIQLGVEGEGETVPTTVGFAGIIHAVFDNDATYPWTIVDGHIQSSNAGVSSSTSAISVTITYPEDGVIEFDAECMGEGTSSYWDHCDFYIDDTRVLYAGANISGWNHYSYDVTAGEHTFVWSYTKDSSVNPTGDYFAIDNVVLPLPEKTWEEPVATEETVHTFTLDEAGMYYVHVQGVCDGETGGWSEDMLIDFTPVDCESGIVLNEANEYTWKADFEGITNITKLFTGVTPSCWTVAHEYTSPSINHIGLEADTLPQLYRSFNTTDGGQYSLRMKYRSLLAMPVLDESVDMSRLQMTLNVRQPQTYYKLQIGVMSDLNDESTFVPVATVNNASTSMEEFVCNFSSYNGEGRYIAFKNVGGSKVDPYCSNYLDDIVLTYVEDAGCAIAAPFPYREDFESYTTSTGASGVEPDCWDVISEDVALDASTKPQVYRGFNTTAGGHYSLRMKNRCVYAMPEFAENINVKELTMTFKLRQAKSFYRLEVGVVDADGNFVVVEEINNPSTSMEDVTVDFSSLEGDGFDKRIAFHNILRNSANYDYSYNYIDDIELNYTADLEETSKAVADENGDMDINSYLDNIAVYPNPTTGMLHIDAVDVQKVECYSQMGQLVGVYDNVNELNISELANGVYMLRITVPQGVTMRKVVKK